MAENKGLRINEQIRVREVRLIDDTGAQKGIVSTLEAFRMAQDVNLDLVEVAPQADPPVCKILDYGKYRFELEKKLRDSKKKQKLQAFAARFIGRSLFATVSFHFIKRLR